MNEVPVIKLALQAVSDEFKEYEYREKIGIENKMYLTSILDRLHYITRILEKLKEEISI